MPVYKYTGTRVIDGTAMSGRVYAKNREEAREDVIRSGITPRNIGQDYRAIFSSIGRPLSPTDLVLFARTSATMLAAGVPLPAVYRSLLEAEISPNLHYVIRRMIVQLESGQSAAEAMAAHARQFPRMYATMIKIGEDTGRMDQAFTRLALLTERTQMVRNRVKKAMVYPITITVFAILAIIALLLFVLPKFVEIFESSGVDLPAPTRLMMGASDLIMQKWHLLIAGIVAGILILRWVLRRDAIRATWDRISIRVPALGPVALKGQCAQFTRALETLIRSGIALIEALELASPAFTNRVLRNAIIETRRQVLNGSGLVEPLRAARVFPPMVITMLSIGEEVGEIDQMLGRVADMYEDDVERAVDSAIELINPIMLVVFGGLVMMIMAAIYLPMIDMISAIN